MRGGAEVACKPHKLEVVGSNPTPATKCSSNAFRYFEKWY